MIEEDNNQEVENACSEISFSLHAELVVGLLSHLGLGPTLCQVFGLDASIT